MNLRSIITFEVQKNENSFVFSVPLGAKYQEAYDAGTEILQKIIEMSNQQKPVSPDELDQTDSKTEKE